MTDDWNDAMDVGELLTWIEIHAGTDREVWQWWPGGLLCRVNGLACEVRYATSALPRSEDSE